MVPAMPAKIQRPHGVPITPRTVESARASCGRQTSLLNIPVDLVEGLVLHGEQVFRSFRHRRRLLRSLYLRPDEGNDEDDKYETQRNPFRDLEVDESGGVQVLQQQLDADPRDDD